MDQMIKKYLPMAVITAVLTEINFYPPSSTLRISLGIIILNLILLVREDIEPFSFSILCGSLVALLRTGMLSLFGNVSFYGAFIVVIPSFAYYCCYAVLFKVLYPQKRKGRFFTAIMAMAAVDFTSNCVEALIRGHNIGKLLAVVAMTAFVRAIAAWFLYILWEKHELYILSLEHQKRYSQLNAFFANVESELFYLRKSAGDIEAVMSKAYHLYGSLENTHEKQLSLEIAKDIHEVKKDYLRVTKGFEELMESAQTMDLLHITDIFSIMKTNYGKLLSQGSKKVQLIFEHKGEASFKEYLKIFTILNNLVDNGLTACKNGDRIHISYEKTVKSHIFRVVDTGPGIPEENLKLIFEPGYTTKFEAFTGKPGTGIGLTHVKNCVSELKGTIEVDSILGTGTRFSVSLPCDENTV